MNSQESDKSYEKYAKLSPYVQQIKFINCCKEGEVEAIKLFLTSPELSKNIDIHHDNDEAFRYACTFGHYEIVQYLIIEYGIKKTQMIEDYLSAKIHIKFQHQGGIVESCIDEAIELFKKREFHDQLNHHLLSDNISNEHEQTAVHNAIRKEAKRKL